MKRLFVSVALLPMVHAAQAAAETTISTARTTPIATSTAANGSRDDLTIAAAGSVRPSQAGPAVILDSDNKVVNRGAIGFEGQNGATGVFIVSGRSATVQNFGAISLVEDYTAADTDKDGDLDGPVATGTGRFGLRLTGAGDFRGDIANERGGTISIEGADSAGVALESRVVGSVRQAGAITVTGDRSVGVRTAGVTGEVSVTGAVNAVGQGASALTFGDVGGRVTIQNAVSATGYRSVQRPADKAVRDKLDADDLLQGGPAIRLTGDVGGGVLLDRPPANLSTTDEDEDKDGVKDAEEGVAAVSSYGSAAALEIGGPTNTRLGPVGTGENAFGLIIKGQVLASGVYDGIAATAVRIGVDGGGATLVEGGVAVAAGGIEATAFEADATALRLNADSRVQQISNAGKITSLATAESARTAIGVLIDAGADSTTLRNRGQITAEIAGEKGSAVAVLDRSGTITTVENDGVIRGAIRATDDAGDTDDSNTDAGDEVITGRAIALDLRANRSGIVITQTGLMDGDDGADGKADADADGDGVDDADEAAIVGDVLLGSGADRLNLRNGVLTGAVSFGDGDDVLVLDGGARLTGAVSDTDGRLSIELRRGALDLRGTESVQLSSLTIGADGDLSVTVDPATGKVSRLNVSGTANLAAGAQVDLRLTSVLKDPASFVIIDAQALQVGQLNGGLSGTPYLYTAALRADTAAGNLIADVRRRTAAEMSLRRSEAQAYEALSTSLDKDARVEAAFLARTGRAEFLDLYDQLLPDHSGGSIMSAAAIASAVSSAVNGRGSSAEPAATGLWAQEIFFDLEQDRENAMGYEAQGIGLAAGIEEVTANNSAIGLNLSVVSTDYSDQNAGLGEQVNMLFGGAGVYGRLSRGRFRADARAGVGYVRFDSDRRISAPTENLNATAHAEWDGWYADAQLGASYQQPLGRFFARPEVSLEYVRLQESDYSETGAGAGLDLTVDSRSADLLSGVAALALGASFGQELRWTPEVKAGWRQRFAGDIGRTTARLSSGGSQFTLTGEDAFDDAAILRLSLKAESGGTSVSVDGGAEFSDRHEQYDLRATVRFSF